jgi:hypothetical protein
MMFAEFSGTQKFGKIFRSSKLRSNDRDNGLCYPSQPQNQKSIHLQVAMRPM